MHSFQTFLKNTRESKSLEQQTISDATNLSLDAIQTIEDADNKDLLENSGSLLKNQVRRYCEYLEIKERKIISILNKIDLLYFKKSRYGKLKMFDYINRLFILIIILAIGFLAYDHIKQNMQEVENIEINNQGKSAIIYTPINYESGDPVSDNNNDKTPEPATSKNIVSHPPATANMSNMTIGVPSDEEIQQQDNTTDTSSASNKDGAPMTINTVQPNDAKNSNLTDHSSNTYGSGS
jgi:cytoskeletal protein RodZ